ncbi:Mur ligase family protein [Alicyclobacillus ferrooxydans]|uniref:Mur ligase family protein n=1 Tax=Alicyclobacillus ferrooxydans TaxID=471514 RepID=UPI0006D52FDD|nr:Mur ligase family protein [Alicyclobacillus ferrooxydans]
MVLPAIWLGKLLSILLRLAGRNATSLPGKMALRLSPKLLSVLGAKLDRCVVVTGTNGKTTTSSLLAGILNADEPIIHNREGANLPQGLTTAVLQHTTWFGTLRRKTALFEIDEATLPLVTRHLPVKVLVVTNVFRDQLDRYGELDTTVTKLLEGIRQTDAVLVVNGDDPLAKHIALHSGLRYRTYGLSTHHAEITHHDQMRDGAFCMQCGHELTYSGFFYGQLGLYHCPECGFSRTTPDFAGTYNGHTIAIDEDELPQVEFVLPSRGLYNVYNTLAAISAARLCGMNANGIAVGLAAYEAPLGRMQGFQTTPPSTLNLIKNPTGCDTVLQAILSEPGQKAVCIAINDLAADGKDVSWLWDAGFEQLTQSPDIRVCITTGLRAEDMALRLKYAGYPTDKILTAADLDAGLQLAFEQAESLGELDLYVLSTYTALYPTAAWLEKKVTLDAKTPLYRTSVS